MGFVFICLKVSPFPRGGDSGDVGKNGSPEGHRLCEPYQNSDEEGLPRNQLHPLANDWREAWRVVRVPP